MILLKTTGHCNYEWFICDHIKTVAMIQGLQGECTKFWIQDQHDQIQEEFDFKEVPLLETS